jgi:hypothetical protein
VKSGILRNTIANLSQDEFVLESNLNSCSGQEIVGNEQFEAIRGNVENSHFIESRREWMQQPHRGRVVGRNANFFSTRWFFSQRGLGYCPQITPESERIYERTLAVFALWQVSFHLKLLCGRRPSADVHIKIYFVDVHRCYGRAPCRGLPSISLSRKA